MVDDRNWKPVLAGIAALFCADTAMSGPGNAKEETLIPDFSSNEIGWIAQGVNFQLPQDGPHQVTNDPAHPFKPPGRGEAPTFRVADLSNPILTPWARDELKKRNDRILGGGTGYTRQVSCWPMGVPAFLLYPAQPLYVVQGPKEVLLIAQMDNQVRHVYLNTPHSKRVKPSWYGESVGHYEGDTLVVDTIGQNTQTYVDNYRTPHSEKLHVVERFHLTNEGKNLQAEIFVEDPATFKQPVKLIQTWRRVAQGPMAESSCAESGPGFFDFDVEPIPTALKADF